MKHTGMIRKIDELGRIVIPIEIRKNLNIKPNETLEIYINEESILLKKYNQMKNLETYIEEYVTIFNKVLNLSIVVTDLNKVIFVTKENNMLENKELNKEFLSLLNERKIYSTQIKKNTWFKNITLNSYAHVCPLISNTELYGSIILITNNPITNIEKNLVELLVNLIKNNLNNV